MNIRRPVGSPLPADHVGFGNPAEMRHTTDIEELESLRYTGVVALSERELYESQGAAGSILIARVTDLLHDAWDRSFREGVLLAPRQIVITEHGRGNISRQNAREIYLKLDGFKRA